jgi:hypothetical protein
MLGAARRKLQLPYHPSEGTHSKGAKARATMAGVKQQGYGDPRGGHVVGSIRQQAGTGNQHQKATRGERKAKNRPPDNDGDCREMRNLKVAPRQLIPPHRNPRSEGRRLGIQIHLSQRPWGDPGVHSFLRSGDNIFHPGPMCHGHRATIDRPR